MGKKTKKKGKKGKAESSSGLNYTGNFGKYGLLKAEDLYKKRQEFFVWMAEVKNMNCEGIAPWEHKLHFKDYMEDYNTATLPKKKYYDLEGWEREQHSKRKAKKKETAPASHGVVSFDDERARKIEIEQVKEKRKADAQAQAYMRLKRDKDMLDDMKHQRTLQAQQVHMNRSGNMDEAKKLGERLDPG